jgi:site-specific recombinase XerD
MFNITFIIDKEIMIRIRYNLQKKNEPSSIIMISINWGTPERIQKSTGLTIPTKNWDSDRYRVKNHNHSLQLNLVLSKIEEELSKYYYELISMGEVVTKKKLNDRYLELRNHGVQNDKRGLTLLEVFKKFKEEYKIDGSRPAPKTLEKYQTTIGKIIKYEKEKNTKLSFHDINSDFYESFLEFLMGIGNNNNTINTELRVLKKFMKWSREKKYHNNKDYKSFKMLKGITKNKSVLSVEELKGFENYVPITADEEFTRLFVLTNCAMGFRAGDLLNMIKEYDIKEGIQSIIQKKTQSKQMVNIDSTVIERIERMKELNTDRITIDVVNRNMKKIAKKLGFNRIERVASQVGNRTIYENVKRYELMSSHVCRRTFVTLSMMNNIPIPKIMKFSGHSTLRAFQIYLSNIDYVDNKPIKGLW